MNILAFSSILVFISSLGIGFFVYLKGKDRDVVKIWIIFCISIAIWGGGVYIFSSTEVREVALLGWRIANAGVILIPVTFYHFIYVFLSLKGKFQRRLKTVIYSLGIVFSIINFCPKEIFVGDVSWIFNQFYYGDWWIYKAPLYLLFYFLFYWILLLYAFFLLIINYKYSKGTRREQLKYFIFAAIVGWLGPTFLWPIVFRIYIYPYSNFLIALYPLIIAYAILKYRLMDIRVFITRALAFLISYPFLLSIPFLFGYQMYPIIEPIMGKHWWLVPAGLLAFIATLAPLAYEQLKGRMEATLLAEQKRYQKLLLQAASGMVTEHNLNRLAKLIVYIVKRIVRLRYAAIFLDDKKEESFKLKATRDTGGIPYQNVDFPYEHPLISYMGENREPFMLEELPQKIRDAIRAPVPVGLIVPCAVEENLLGFVFLGEKVNRQPYTEDDINVFKILSHQAALAIENCIFLEEFKQAQERIFTAEKLASIGGMADGVAHQIKNRLNQFSVASGELKYEIKDFIEKYPDLANNNPDLKKTFEYLTNISDSLVANVKRTDGILRGILNFARVEEKESFFGEFSLKEVIDLAIELLRVKHEIAQAPLTVKLDTSDLVYGVKSQITEVIYNLFDNAYEATQERKTLLEGDEKDNYSPHIEVKLTQSPSISLIEISDNGIGIKKEDKGKIFAPFYTTKSSYKSGTGIGMYVVRRMVEENHKGRVWFVSSPMQGTSFFVELPKK